MADRPMTTKMASDAASQALQVKHTETELAKTQKMLVQTQETLTQKQDTLTQTQDTLTSVQEHLDQTRKTLSEIQEHIITPSDKLQKKPKTVTGNEDEMPWMVSRSPLLGPITKASSASYH